jgi:2-polyprenyl-3-methyl-5-hydroxy-6-metoxy-1,4-benzoquinol methylase
VKNPIELNIYNSMKKKVDLQFIKVKKDKKFLLDSNYFDLIYHYDVIEHTRKPYNLISENYRLLKKGGILFFSTPNLLRLSNIMRLFLGKLQFPNKIGYNEVIKDYIHEKEYHMEDLKILLEEIGFKKIFIFTRLFGLINLQLFFDFKKNSLLKQMGHIIFIKAIK